MQKIVQPAVREVRITKRIGWHTFRRTTATWLIANGESVKTSQELMRHSNPTMMLGTYAQALDADKRLAQNRITELLGMTCSMELQAATA